MSKFLSYLRNDKGGAVEYVLVVAGVGGLIMAAMSNAALKTSFNEMFSGMFGDAATTSKGLVK